MCFILTAATAAVDSLKIPTQSYHLFVKKQDNYFVLAYFLLRQKINSFSFVQTACNYLVFVAKTTFLLVLLVYCVITVNRIFFAKPQNFRIFTGLL